MDDSIGNHAESDGEWIAVSDLMAALMVVFLFIAIVYIRPLTIEREKVREIAIAWQASEQAILDALVDEFEQDLKTWDAEIDASTLLVRFRSPDILFDAGLGTIKPRFKAILDDFFPRYVAVLAPFRSDIEEVRIEGHTSSEWNDADEARAYFENMRLSQDRTRSVLEYVMRPGVLSSDPEWLLPLLTANGLSSSQVRRDSNGTELVRASRRVEFRVRTRTRTEIRRILETVDED